jgi:hypothetical protein
VASAHRHATRPPFALRPAAEPRVRAAATRRSEVVEEAARYLGALSILVVGAVHAQQYYQAYFSVVPVIGRLFLLSFVGSAVVGAVLLAPVRRLGRNAADLILGLAALGAIGIALGSLVSLLVSEYTPLFGFMESGYRLAIVIAIVSDVTTTVFLAVFLLLVARSRLRSPMESTVTSEGTGR